MTVKNFDNGIVVLKDFFSIEEYNVMWQELCFLCQDEFLIDSKHAGGAVDQNKVLLRHNRGLPLESIYSKIEESNLASITKKIYDKQIVKTLIDVNEIYSYLLLPMKETNLINHYMNDHKYDFHRDNCVFTAITLFWREPKLFVGGELQFKIKDQIIIPELGLRDLIIFPSYIEHSVTQLSLESNENMSGRISLSKFLKLL